MNTIDPPPEIRLDSNGRIGEDLACVSCGYNLRGLNPNGRCPECYAAIGQSLLGDFLRFREPVYVEHLASGAYWIIASIVLSLGAAFLLFPLLGMVGGMGLRPSSLLTVLVTFVLQVVALAGLWRLTTPDPAKRDQEAEWNARRLARVGAVVGLALLPVQQIGLLAGSGLAGTVLGLAIGALATFTFLTHLRQLALRIPAERLAKHTRIVMWGMVIPVVSVAFQIWFVVLIVRYRNLLQQAANEARASWADQPVASR